MNTSSTQSKHLRGFTLIELMVVIAIVAVLAAMGYAAGIGALRRAGRMVDQTAAVGLADGIDRFYHDYGCLPDLGEGGSGGDTETISDPGLMNVLMAFGLEGKAQNPKGMPYYSGSIARGSSRDRAYRGLYYSGSSTVELFDAWRKSAPLRRHYQVLMDTNYDGEIAHPIASGKTLYYMRVLVWSTGRDGEEARGDERDPKNRDNVYSWQ